MLGIGNIVMGDDGVGVRVVEKLSERYQFSAPVTILDGGTLGLDLLPRLRGVTRLLVIDAVDVGGLPGTIARLENEQVPAVFKTKLSPHQMGLQDLLAVAALLGDLPKTLVLLGVQPDQIGLNLELSPAVENRVETLEKMALDELQRWGITANRIDAG